MCGIAGTVGFVPFSECRRSALQTMVSRGPDDTHELNISTNAWMGAVRLAFQDIERGRQPIVCDHGRVIVSLNGEVYNYKELAEELTAKGWRLETLCDTELVGILYLEYGYSAFNRIKGMFALAIFDRDEDIIVLATDFLSQKPLYYFRCKDGCLVYASDSSCLDILSGGETIPYKNEGVQDVILYKAKLHMKEDSRSIKRLGPGQLLKVDVKSCKINTKTYYDYRCWLNRRDKPCKNGDQAIIDNVENLLLSAVKRRVDETKSQVVFLSGGVDSSLIIMMLRKLFPKININSFTLCYKGYNITGKNLDRDLAKRVSDLSRTNHHEIFCRPANMINHIRGIIDCFDCAFSAVPSMWYVTKEMHLYGKYTLSGDGADELFGSYYTHRNAAIEGIQSSTDALFFVKRYLATFWPTGFLDEAFLSRELTFCPSILDILGDDVKEEPIKIQLMTEALTIFPSTVLTYVDRLSMVHSLEARSPFLDSDLWEYVMSLPDRFRIRNGETKYVLKKVAERYLPRDVIYRQKEGFVYPVSSYLVAHRNIISSSIRMIPPNILEGIFSAPLDSIVEDLYNEVDEEGSLTYKAAQALHTLYCIYVDLSRRNLICA